MGKHQFLSPRIKVIAQRASRGVSEVGNSSSAQTGLFSKNPSARSYREEKDRHQKKEISDPTGREEFWGRIGPFFLVGKVFPHPACLLVLYILGRG